MEQPDLLCTALALNIELLRAFLYNLLDFAGLYFSLVLVSLYLFLAFVGYRAPLLLYLVCAISVVLIHPLHFCSARLICHQYLAISLALSELLLLTLDAEKAFDKLNHEILFNKLYHNGIKGALWVLLRNMYRSMLWIIFVKIFVTVIPL
jgi:hypothetical protein